MWFKSYIESVYSLLCYKIYLLTMISAFRFLGIKESVVSNGLKDISMCWPLMMEETCTRQHGHKTRQSCVFTSPSSCGSVMHMNQHLNETEIRKMVSINVSSCDVCNVILFIFSMRRLFTFHFHLPS